MFKKGLGQGLGLVFISAIIFFVGAVSASAEEETITITTYYPSPYGSYRELRSQRMAIGNTWYEGANVCWDDGGTEPSCTGMGGQMEIPDSSDADLVVEGNVGIGTTKPGAKLDLGPGESADGTGVYAQKFLLLNTGSGKIKSGWGHIYYEDRIFFPTTGGGEHLSFGTISNSDGWTWSEKARITEAGNVGIGTGTTGPASLFFTGANDKILDINSTTKPALVLHSGFTDWSIGVMDTTGNLNFVQEDTGERMVIDNAGNVGIGTTTPNSSKGTNGYLDVKDVYLRDANKWASEGVHSGAVMSFNRPSCPSGWSELTNARGRYIVGLPSGGTLAAQVGTALSNTENRPVGRHRHGINHAYYGSMNFNWGTSNPIGSWSSGYTDYEGTTDGTNAPYIQLLVCQKN